MYRREREKAQQFTLEDYCNTQESFESIARRYEAYMTERVAAILSGYTAPDSRISITFKPLGIDNLMQWVTDKDDVNGNWRGADGLWRTKHDGKVLVWRSDSIGWEVEGDIEYAPKEEYGPVCARCNEVSPYAVKVDGFMCWACRQPH